MRASVAHDTNFVDSPTITTRSVEQERAADLEHERMTNTTQKIIKSEPSLTPASIQELRVVFQYWCGRRSARTSDSMLQAEALLNWMLENNLEHVVETVVESEESCNSALLNMIETYMIPFRSTNRAIAFGEAPLRHHVEATQLMESLQLATGVAKKMKLLHENAMYSKLVPDFFSCNILLNLWLKRVWFLRNLGEFVDEAFVQNAFEGVSTISGCLSEMQDIINDMKSEESYPSPDQDTYTLLMTAWVQSGLSNAVEEAESLLKLMEDDPTIKPSVVPYNTLLFAYANAAKDDPMHADQASSFLQHIQRPEQPDLAKPDVSSFAVALLAYANAGRPEEAEELLEKMESGIENQVLPNTICYNTVLDGWARSNSPNALSRAQAVLKRMQDIEELGLNPDVKPDHLSYSAIILALARSSRPDAAGQAESILFELESMSAQEGNAHYKPDLITYNIVLDAWAKQSGTKQHESSQILDDRSAGERAEHLLRYMHEQHEEAKGNDTTKPWIQPDSTSYNSVLDAWSKSGSPDALHRVKVLLDKMSRERAKGNMAVKRDTISCNIVLKTVAKHRSVEEAEKFLNKMPELGVKPNVISFNNVIEAWVKTGDSGVDHAEEMLQSMEENYESGVVEVRPDAVSYNIVINGLSKSHCHNNATRSEALLDRMIVLSEQSGRGDMRPSHITFSTVLDAYSRTNEQDALERAEALLNRMEDYEHVQANAICYNTIINVLSKHGAEDAPQRAEQILHRMHKLAESGNDDVKPNSVTYTSVINCWARSPQEGGAQRAEAMLNLMEKLAAEGNSNIKPTVVTYSTVLNVWAKSGEKNAADSAVRLLEQMEAAAQGGMADFVPNSVCYNATINAIAKSKKPDKANKARSMLDRMWHAFKKGNRYAKPSIISYGSVLNACAYTRGSAHARSEAFRVARKTFLEMMDSQEYQPNNAAFNSFMLACRNLQPRGDERDLMMASIFQECCKTGNVDRKVIKNLQSSLPRYQVEELLEGATHYDDLPRKWTRNVPQSRQQTRKYNF